MSLSHFEAHAREAQGHSAPLFPPTCDEGELAVRAEHMGLSYGEEAQERAPGLVATLLALWAQTPWYFTALPVACAVAGFVWEVCR